MSNRSLLIRNSKKSFIVLMTVAISFIAILTTFALIGFGSVQFFPLEIVLFENLKLLIPFTIANILFAPIYGYSATKRTSKRIGRFFLIAVLNYWVTILIAMIFYTNGAILFEIVNMILLSFYVLFSYSFLVAPLMVPAVFIINKWTQPSNRVTN